MKITHFDKQMCGTLGTAVEQALQKVGEEFGVKIQRKSGTYSPTSYTMKIEASVIGQDGIVLSREAEDFKTYCHMFNLEPSDFGKTFVVDGTIYKIKGLSIRSSKFPILAENMLNGKTFKLPERTVQRGLGRKIKESPFGISKGDLIPM